MKTINKVFLLIILAVSFGISGSAFSSVVDETLAKIELEKNAKCGFLYQSAGFEFTTYHWHKKYYHCVSNSGDFKLGLKVRAEVVYSEPRYGISRVIRHINPVVTKVIYYK